MFLLNLIIFLKYFLILILFIYIYINIFFFLISFLKINIIFFINFLYILEELFWGLNIIFYIKLKNFLFFFKKNNIFFFNQLPEENIFLKKFKLLNFIKIFFYKIIYFFKNKFIFFKFGWKKNYFMNIYFNHKKKYTNWFWKYRF